MSKALQTPASFVEKAPEVFSANFDTSAGAFVVEVHRAWAPHGADRFYNLVKNGFFDDVRFFRVISNFMVQFGINGDPAVSSPWRSARIPDDPVKESNKRGHMTFATAGPNTRTTQVFINFKDQVHDPRCFGEVRDWIHRSEIMSHLAVVTQHPLHIFGQHP